MHIGHFRTIYNQLSTSNDDIRYKLEDIEAAIDILSFFISGFARTQYRVSELGNIQSRFLSLYQQLLMHSQRISNCSVVAIGVEHPVSHSASGRGRPKICVNLELVELLHSAGFKLQEIAKSLMISRVTLWRRLCEEGVILTSYSGMSDDELDGIVKDIKRIHPFSGFSLLFGTIKSRGINIQCHRLRDSIRRVDPIRTNVRLNQVVQRRTYTVPGPNSLWHIDGNHSLIRWRFVIHGGIDGFSRMITYLHCSTNNKSHTVYNLFVNAVDCNGCPSRVRSDKGVENEQVCLYMIRARGTGRHSHIAGSSTHNQRIERLWRDVFRCVASTFYSLFYYLEDQGMLDPLSDVDLFVLHTVFLSRINHCLKEFTESWNNHPMRNEMNWSPKKIWLNGMINPNNAGHTAIQEPEVNPDSFGIDNDGPLALEGNSDEEVVVPETITPISEEQLEQFVEQVDPLCECDDFGFEKYREAKLLLQSIIQ